MAQHKVNFFVPRRPLESADIEFEVRRNGKKFGTLHVSKGAVVWQSANREYGRRVGWTRLDEMFEERGDKRRP